MPLEDFVAGSPSERPLERNSHKRRRNVQALTEYTDSPTVTRLLPTLKEE